MPLEDAAAGRARGLRFEHGIYAIVFSSPISVAATNASLVFALGLFVRDWWLGRRRPLATPLDGAIFASALVTIVATAFSTNPVESFRDLRSQGHWLIFYLVAWSVAGGGPLRGLENAWLVAGIVAALHGILQIVAGIDLLGRPPRGARGFFGGDYAFGVYMAMLLPLAVVRFASARDRIERLLPATAVLAFAACLALSARRGAWVAFLAFAILSTAWLRARTAALAGLAILAAVVLQVGAARTYYPDSVGQYYRSFFAATPDAAAQVDFDRVHSNLWRIWMWRGSLGLFERSPVVGVGPETMPELSPSFDTPYRKFGVAHLHSNYFETLVSRGLFGLAALFAVLLVAIRSLARGLVGGEGDTVRTTAAAMLGLVVVQSVEGLVSFNLGSAPNLMGFLAGLGLGIGAVMRALPERPFERPIRELDVVVGASTIAVAWVVHRSGVVPPAVAAAAGLATLAGCAALGFRRGLAPLPASVALAFGFVAVGAAALVAPVVGVAAAARIVGAAAIPFVVAETAIAFRAASRTGRELPLPDAPVVTGSG